MCAQEGRRREDGDARENERERQRTIGTSRGKREEVEEAGGREERKKERDTRKAEGWVKG